MKNPRKTLLYVFLGYHLLFVIGALYIDARQDDLGFLLSIKGYLPWMKYFALLGLTLFLIAYLVVIRDTRSLRKSVSQAKEEHTLLKAKLFDLQEASKGTPDTSSQSIKKETDPVTEEKEEEPKDAGDKDKDKNKDTGPEE